MRTAAFLCALLIGFSAAANGEPSEQQELTLRQALTQGQTQVSLRYRYEGVDEEAVDKEGHAATLRTTLSYRTQEYRGFSLFLQGEDVRDTAARGLHRNLGAGSLSNGVVGRPVIADPQITEANQAYLRYSKGKTQIDLGRFELALGDQRFVGPVGWRQNHQSFDGLRLNAEWLPQTTLSYAYLENANRIFGDNKAMASHLLSSATKTPAGTVRLYGLRLDYDRLADAGLSTSTYGIELAGKRSLGATTLLYEAEIARQSDSGRNPNPVQADYNHVLLGGSWGKRSAKIGWEVLEGRPGSGRFTTPLATLHKFNGWADKFLNTPQNGLEDLWLSFASPIGPCSALLTVHRMTSDTGGADYGNELDFQLTYRSPQGLSFGLKGALFDADSFSSDTAKLWIWSSYTFQSSARPLTK